MPQADIDTILEAGWPEEAAYKAMLVTCLFNFMNRVIHGAGVDRMKDRLDKDRENVRKQSIEDRRTANTNDVGKPHYRMIRKKIGLD